LSILLWRTWCSGRIDAEQNFGPCSSLKQLDVKHLLLLFMLTCIALFDTNAQNSDFAPVGAKWYYSELNFELRNVHEITSLFWVAVFFALQGARRAHSGAT
jgi:hypothetical protein